MKNILFSFILTFAMIPFAANAHVGSVPDSQETELVMMQQMEDQVFGDELHEEMEDLMVTMMSTGLSQNEADRMIELMDQYPGAGSMMMGRMMGMSDVDSGVNNFNNGSMMGYGFGGGIFMILFWALVIVGIVILVKYVTGNATKSRGERNALAILEERYAKGEINKEEFDARKKDLG